MPVEETKGPEKPLAIIRGMKGVVKAFYLDKNILKQMKEEEAKVRAVGDIIVDNIGFSTALTREHVIAIVKDPRFRPPPEPTVELHSADGKVLGVEVFPFTAQQYLSRSDVVWLSDAFVMFPTVKAKAARYSSCRVSPSRSSMMATAVRTSCLAVRHLPAIS